jgi:hypothetical protein
VAQSPLGGGSGRFLGFVGMEGDLFAGGAAASFKKGACKGRWAMPCLRALLELERCD